MKWRSMALMSLSNGITWRTILLDSTNEERLDFSEEDNLSYYV